MAVTLTASNSLDILTEVQLMWSNATAAGTQYQNDVTTITKLANSQDMRFREVLDDTGKCIDWIVWWPDLTDTRATAVYSGTTANPSADCTVPTGQPIGTQSNTYNPNRYITKTVTVDDDLCANEATFAGLAAAQLNAAMLMMREELNKQAILWLNSNKTANVDATRASTGMTISGTTTTVPASLFDNQNILKKFDIIAESNRLGMDYLIMDSTNLLLSEKMAPFLALNDNQRSEGGLYGSVAARYNADLRQMASVTGDSPTFLVNPHMFGFGCRTKYSSVPTLIDTANNTNVYSIADPQLRYRRVNVDQNGRVLGTEIVPVMYDVEYQKVCNGRDTGGRRTYTHTWTLMFEGFFLLGPEANSGATNILKFTLEDEI